LARTAGVRASAAVPIRRHGRVVGAFTVYAGETNFFDTALLGLLGELADDISFALDSFDHEEKRQRAEAELHDALEQLHVLSARLIDVQEAERRSLARDLHDDIGQNLTMLKIMLHAQAATHPDSEDVAAAGELADRTLQRIRALSFALRPPQLDDLGLVPALRAQLDATCKQAGLTASFHAEAVPEHLPEAIAIACFRIVQEALTNVVRHAAASAVTLSLRGEGSTFRLALRDNGRGFDVDAALARAAQGKSLGLLSMRERATLAGGQLSLASQPGENEVQVVFALPEGAA
jgi:signal transduction histidine kinase